MTISYKFVISFQRRPHGFVHYYSPRPQAVVLIFVLLVKMGQCQGRHYQPIQRGFETGMPPELKLSKKCNSSSGRFLANVIVAPQSTKWRSFQLLLHKLERGQHLSVGRTNSMRDARIALNIITFYLGFGVNLVGAFAPTIQFNSICFMNKNMYKSSNELVCTMNN